MRPCVVLELVVNFACYVHVSGISILAARGACTPSPHRPRLRLGSHLRDLDVVDLQGAGGEVGRRRAAPGRLHGVVDDQEKGVVGGVGPVRLSRVGRPRVASNDSAIVSELDDFLCPRQLHQIPLGGV
jgi:hypothetical protein